ncbi:MULTISPECIES: hypothetical protein [Marinovum]|uniref:hypothetical protein n=1 Tax=Marinovum TaxID=367771 RepID=UPI00237A7471|nr:hypothetical protein [Marinovum sp. PR37]MDD9744728.1 hypothetical protein [Marinovum sp. PR37]
MSNKRTLYEEFIDRIDASIASDHFFEASWYVYAALEDRLISMLQQSGGSTFASGKPIKMLGPKIGELDKRQSGDPLLAANFPKTEVEAWGKRRNDLMHAMADGSLTIEQIDADAKSLAIDGRDLLRNVAAAAMRLKKHRNKVAPSP